MEPPHLRKGTSSSFEARSVDCFTNSDFEAASEGSGLSLLFAVADNFFVPHSLFPGLDLHLEGVLVSCRSPLHVEIVGLFGGPKWWGEVKLLEMIDDEQSPISSGWKDVFA